MPYVPKYRPRRKIAAKKTLRKTKMSVKYRRNNTIKAIAKSVVNKMAEKKEIVAGFVANISGNNSASTTISPDTNIQRLDPHQSGSFQIAQGDKQNDRSGNKVRLVSGKLTLGIWPRPDAAGNTNNLQNIRIMMVYDKRNPTTDPTPFANLDFFEQSSTNGYVGFTGIMYDLINRVNESRYGVLYDRTIKLGQAYLPVSGDPGYNYGANNDFKAFYKLTIPLTKKCIKQLTYKDSQTTAQWRGCWLFCYGVAATGSANTANIYVANMYGQVVWKFTDI